MEYFLCPLCNEPISGIGETDLSRNLKLHFISKHSLAMSPTPIGSNTRPDDFYQESYEEKATENFHNASSGGLPGEALPESVICPICGDAVRGLTPDKLSYNLAYHMNSVHDLKVKFSGKA